MSVKILEVAVGLIQNSKKQILLTSRKHKLYLSDLWEFPGGKIEVGETAQEAVVRELKEELAIDVKNPQKLISTCQQYPHALIYIHAFFILDWQGEVIPCDGQEFFWCDDLYHAPILSADTPIIHALQLPQKYLITPSNQSIDDLQHIISANPDCLIQYRDPGLLQSSPLKFAQIASVLIKQAHQSGQKILINSEPQLALDLHADGVHCNSHWLNQLSDKPIDLLVSASCHNSEQIKKANDLLIDFIVLSSIRHSTSHPINTVFLGWDGFAKLVSLCQMPVYALGGVSKSEVGVARQMGGQGVAGVDTFISRKPD